MLSLLGLGAVQPDLSLMFVSISRKRCENQLWHASCTSQETPFQPVSLPPSVDVTNQSPNSILLKPNMGSASLAQCSRWPWLKDELTFSVMSLFTFFISVSSKTWIWRAEFQILDIAPQNCSPCRSPLHWYWLPEPWALGLFLEVWVSKQVG